MKRFLSFQQMLRYLALPFLLAIFAVNCLSQTGNPRPQPSPLPTPRQVDMSADKSSSQEDRAPLTTFEEEMRAKREIRLAEKEHEENLKRAREVSQLAKDMRQLATSRPTLNRDDYKKIERLEKLTKKIRDEAGGDNEEVNIIDKPTDLPSALTQISEKAEALSKDVQNTPRQVVSASVIGNANVLLELIRLLRGFTRPTGN